MFWNSDHHIDIIINNKIINGRVEVVHCQEIELSVVFAEHFC